MALDSPPRNDSGPSLLSKMPTTSAPADLKIMHVQLRDLVVCPKDRGVVWYVNDNKIIEHDILSKSLPHVLTRIRFTPVTLAALPVDDDKVLLAAGGQEAELFLGLYTYMSKLVNESFFDDANDLLHGMMSEEIWSHQASLQGSINNSVLLYHPPRCIDGPSTQQQEEQLPRLVVSNNDTTVKFYNICLSKEGFSRRLEPRYWPRPSKPSEILERFEKIGSFRLNVAVNHTSISPDGSTILSCGDSPNVFLHRILPSSHSRALEFEHIATYTLPESTLYPTPSSPSETSTGWYPSYTDQYATIVPSVPYNSHFANMLFGATDGWTASNTPLVSCFSTAWSSDGSKFAVASQEGMVAVWDVRCAEPLPMARWETSRASSKARSSRTQLPDGNSLGESSTAAARVEGMTDSFVGSSFLASQLDERERAGLNVDGDVRPWLEETRTAPSWGVRNVKFAKPKNGKEILVFTEHACLFHVIDAETFEKHEIVRVPHVRVSSSFRFASPDGLPAPSQLPTSTLEDRYRLSSHRRRSSAFSWPRRTSLYSQTAPSTDRLSRTPSGSRTTTTTSAFGPQLAPSPERRRNPITGMRTGGSLSRGYLSSITSRSAASELIDALGSTLSPEILSEIRRLTEMDNEEPDEFIAESPPRTGSNVVFLPPMPEEETEEVRRVLNSHGLTVATSSAYPPSSTSDVRSSDSYSQIPRGSRSIVRETPSDDMSIDADCTTPPPTTTFRTSSTNISQQPNPQAANTPSEAPPLPAEGDQQTLPPCQDLIENSDRLDIAGIAFDETHDFLYVATIDGITEWKLEGTDARWWCSGNWN